MVVRSRTFCSEILTRGAEKHRAAPSSRIPHTETQYSILNRQRQQAYVFKVWVWFWKIRRIKSQWGSSLKISEETSRIARKIEKPGPDLLVYPIAVSSYLLKEFLELVLLFLIRSQRSTSIYSTVAPTSSLLSFLHHQSPETLNLMFGNGQLYRLLLLGQWLLAYVGYFLVD